MQVIAGTAENGAKIQQWGTQDGTVHDIWKTVDAGDGYFYLYSQVGDGKTFVLDLTDKSSANGTSLEINEYKGETSQQFYLSENSDGSYIIKTRISDNNSAVEIKDGGKESGNLVQQWLLNGEKWQNWIFEEVQLPKYSLSGEEKAVIKTKVYKDKECIHTVVFVK